jgi:hypothetical protein
MAHYCYRFGAGGNLVLDTAIFLEYLPSNKQWLLTLMATWWGLAYVIVATFCWPIYSSSSLTCSEAATCTKANNMVSCSRGRQSAT